MKIKNYLMALSLAATLFTTISFASAKDTPLPVSMMNVHISNNQTNAYIIGTGSQGPGYNSINFSLENCSQGICTVAISNFANPISSSNGTLISVQTGKDSSHSCSLFWKVNEKSSMVFEPNSSFCNGGLSIQSYRESNQNPFGDTKIVIR